MNRKGLSLLEIIVSATIFSMVMAGLAGTFISAKKWLAYSRTKMAGGELGKYFLDPLAMCVRQDQWDDTLSSYGDYEATNGLSIVSSPSTDSKVLNGKSYTATFNITAIPGLDPATYPQARKARVTIKWPKE